MRVLTALNSWLRSVATAADAETVASMRPARVQTEDFMRRLEGMKEEVVKAGGDPTVHHLEDGIIALGGEDGVIVGCTDATLYTGSLQQTSAQDGNEDSLAAIDDFCDIKGKVYGEFFFVLHQTALTSNVNKFIICQLIQEDHQFYQYKRWGRVGETGAHKTSGPFSADEAKEAFTKYFQAKTGSAWNDRHKAICKPGKYEYIK